MKVLVFWTLCLGLLSVLAGLVDGSVNNFWDDCKCNKVGTLSKTIHNPTWGEQTIYQCNKETGQCTCKSGYGGKQCQCTTETGPIATVDCSLTVDDHVVEVLYNKEKLKVEGQLDNWQKEKTIRFESCDRRNPGQLIIKGEDRNQEQHCIWGGLMLHCTASDANSPWHNFKSELEHWKDENGQKPCQNDGGIYSHNNPVSEKFRKNGAKKIWAPRKKVTLTGTPESGR